MDRLAAHEARRLGVPDASEHRAVRLVESQLTGADLVLALAREHRSASVRLSPTANGRSFTLLEFVGILDSLEPDELRRGGDPRSGEGRLRAVVEEAHRMRGVVAMRTGGGADVDDPYGHAPAVHRATADVLDEAVTQLCRTLPALVLADSRWG